MKQFITFITLIFSLNFCQCGKISSGECLSKKISKSSPNECFKLKVSERCLYVENIYTEKVTWSVEIESKNISRACLNEDNNFVIYDEEDEIQWTSETPKFFTFKNYLWAPSSLEIHDDGRLELKYQETNYFIINKPEACFPPHKNYAKMTIDELKAENDELTKAKNELKSSYDENIAIFHKELDELNDKKVQIGLDYYNDLHILQNISCKFETVKATNQNLKSMLKELKDEKSKIESASQNVQRKLKKILRKITSDDEEDSEGFENLSEETFDTHQQF